MCTDAVPCRRATVVHHSSHSATCKPNVWRMRWYARVRLTLWQFDIVPHVGYVAVPGSWLRYSPTHISEKKTDSAHSEIFTQLLCCKLCKYADDTSLVSMLIHALLNFAVSQTWHLIITSSSIWQKVRRYVLCLYKTCVYLLNVYNCGLSVFNKRILLFLNYVAVVGRRRDEKSTNFQRWLDVIIDSNVKRTELQTYNKNTKTTTTDT